MKLRSNFCTLEDLWKSYSEDKEFSDNCCAKKLYSKVLVGAKTDNFCHLFTDSKQIVNCLCCCNAYSINIKYATEE